MNSNQQPSNTIAIIGLILGIIAILFSFIPCLGMLAFIPGVIALILGVIGFLKAKDNGHPQGLSIAVIVVSVIACVISVFQVFFLGNIATEIKADIKEYTTCEELITDYEILKKDMAELTKEIETGPSISAMTNMARLGANLGGMKKQSEELGCNIEFDDIETTDLKEIEELINETESESEGEEDSESN